MTQNIQQPRCFFYKIELKQEAMMTFVFAGANKIIIGLTKVNLGNEGKSFDKNGTESGGICK